MSYASGGTPPPPWLSTATSAPDLDAQVRVRKDAYNARLQHALSGCGGGGRQPSPPPPSPHTAQRAIDDVSPVVARTPYSPGVSTSTPAARLVGNVVGAPSLTSPPPADDCCTCHGGNAIRACCCDRLAAAVEVAKRRIELSRVRQHTHSLQSESMMDAASASDAASSGAAGLSPSSTSTSLAALPPQMAPAAAVDVEAAVARTKLVTQITELESRRAASTFELKQLQSSLAVFAARRREELCALERRRRRAARAANEVAEGDRMASSDAVPRAASNADEEESASETSAAAIAPSQSLILTPLQMMREVQANMEHTEAMAELHRRVSTERLRNDGLEAQLVNTVERAKAACVAHARRYHRQ